MRPLVVYVVGARPNYMKIGPIFAAAAARGTLDQRLVHTGQHYDPELSNVFFEQLPLPEPDVLLHVGSGSHGAQTARALEGLEQTFVELRPDLVVVPGDVNSTLAGALAAVKLEIPVCHVEAGLRSNDWSMPEEHNRRLTDHLSSLLLTHSESANANLAAEGIGAERVRLVGNTMIDTLLQALEPARAREEWRTLGLEPHGYLLVTLHRPALVDSPELLAATMQALGAVARELPVVFPAHPRTRARLAEAGIEVPPGVILTPPLSYLAFVSLESAAAAVLTDSGGVQEETTALGVRCFTLRENTERPATVTHGTNTVIGLDPRQIETVLERLGEPKAPELPPLWDGWAGERAAAAIEELLVTGG
jgi:UDP-N-acetylglucosamine 2-epimerase (non-hydrolysing)